MRTEISVMESMRRCHRTRRQTQLIYRQIGCTWPSMQLVVAAAQLIDELAQTRRQFGVGAQALLQPSADGVTDRRACLVIDLFDIAVDSAIHRRLYEFHLAIFARVE